MDDMSYRYKLTNNNFILNFSEEFCRSPYELIESEGFKKLLSSFIDHHKRHGNNIYFQLHFVNEDDQLLQEELQKIAKYLLVMKVDELLTQHPSLAGYFHDDLFVDAIEAFYLYWRKHQRYAVVYNDNLSKILGYQNTAFMDAQNQFEALVLQTYRTIEERAQGHKNLVYRQITAGVNAGLVVSRSRPILPYEYRGLDKISLIEGVIINPPFITYSKRNKRDGVFPEVYSNPLEDLKFDSDEWFCYPAKVGDLICFIYFNVQFMAQGITLCNLFELCSTIELQDRKPDMIYVYGYDDRQKNQCFYQDNKNDMMVGFLSLDDEFDYFGYMKKMVLTLHNVRKLNQQQLPIHGAMVEITWQDNSQSNVVVMGDSGAGKSETIEQLKGLGDDDIREIKTIYDDMGVLSFDDEGKIVSSGTEIGAFVRLDDLDAGFGYKELDRSVFMNPDKVNARIVIPVSTYKDIVRKHPVDFFLYANNYDDREDSITFFNSPEEALDVFKKGARLAKGTTTETGLVESYFANPFGPVQRQSQTDPLLTTYFNAMFDQNIKVGQLHTRLGIAGQEHQGPHDAAKALLKLLVPQKKDA